MAGTLKCKNDFLSYVMNFWGMLVIFEIKLMIFKGPFTHYVILLRGGEGVLVLLRSIVLGVDSCV